MKAEALGAIGFVLVFLQLILPLISRTTLVLKSYQDHIKTVVPSVN